jgi:hypothetical protein
MVYGTTKSSVRNPQFACTSISQIRTGFLIQRFRAAPCQKAVGTECSSAKRPSAKDRKSVGALLPQMGSVLIWPVLSSIARALISHLLVIGKFPQNPLIGLLVNASWLDRYGSARSPSEPSAQFLDTPR